MSNDKEILDGLGGSASVARILGFSTARVDNWYRRGIPARMKLAHSHLFMRPLAKRIRKAKP